jgi:hypothetical protein
VVNPVVLEITRRRGNLDLDGVRYVVIRYGLQYQVVFPYRKGHISIGVDLQADVTAVAAEVAKLIGQKIEARPASAPDAASGAAGS